MVFFQEHQQEEKMKVQNFLFPFFPLFVMEGGLYNVEIKKTKEPHTFSVFWYESQ